MQLGNTGPAPAPATDSTAPPLEETPTTSPESVGAVAPAEQTRRRHNRGSTILPTRLTPRVQNALRIFSTGISALEACKRSGVGHRYFKRVVNAPIGADYLRLITTRTEEAFIDKAAAVAASDNKLSVSQSAVQNEIDEAVLESVQELRSIVKTSKSDQARALAAKELLDLAQAKKRYMQALTGKETDIELTASDIAAFAAATADLRSLHLTGTVEVAGEALTSETADTIVRTIEAAVDPSVIAAATAVIDQPMPEGSAVDAENARPDGRSPEDEPTGRLPL